MGIVLLPVAFPDGKATGAQEPLVGDRPDFTESSLTIEPGRVQVETGYTFARLQDAKSHTLGEILVRIGLAEPLELRLGLNSFAVTSLPEQEDLTGFEDTFLGAKLHLCAAEGVRPDAGLLAGASLPTGAEDYGVEVLQPEAVLALAWDLSAAVSLGSNIGFAYLEQESERFNQLAASVAVGWGFAGPWGVFLEWFGFVPESRDGPDAHFLDTGVTFLAADDLQFDFRLGLGLNGRDPEYFTGVGIVVRR
jgi:hypothetical protein